MQNTLTNAMRARMKGLVRHPAASMLLLLLLAGLLSGLTGCSPSHKQEAKDISKQGVSTTGDLADYYDALAHDIERSREIQELESYDTANRPLNEQTGKLLDEQMAAMKARAALAGKLKNVYTALGKLVDYDAAGDVKTAVGDLKSAVIKVNSNHPLHIASIPDADVKDVLDRLVGYLTDMEQMRRYRQNLPQALAVLDGIEEFYDREKPVYMFIAQDYEHTRVTAIKLAASLKFANVNVASAFKEDIAPYGEFLAQPSTEPKLVSYLSAQQARLLQARLKAAQGEADQHSIALYRMMTSANRFLHAKPTAPLLTETDLTDVARFASYLKNALAARPHPASTGGTRPPQEETVTPGEETVTPGPAPPMPADPLSDYIAGQLPKNVQERLAAAQTSAELTALRGALVQELNRILQTDDFEAYLEAHLPATVGKHLDDYNMGDYTTSNPAEVAAARIKAEAARVHAEQEWQNALNALLIQGRETDRPAGGPVLTRGELQNFKILLSANVINRGNNQGRRLLHLHPTGRALVRENRRFLETAYPAEIAPAPIAVPAPKPGS